MTRVAAHPCVQLVTTVLDTAIQAVGDAGAARLDGRIKSGHDEVTTRGIKQPGRY